MADPVDGACDLLSLSVSYHLVELASRTARGGGRAGHQIWRMRRTKIRPKQLRPVNTSCVRQAKPTPRVRMKHGSKRGQELKYTQALRSGMIQIYLAGMSSVGRRTVNEWTIFDYGRHNGI